MWLASLCAILLCFARLNVGDLDLSDNLFLFPTASGPNNNFVADLSWAIGSVQTIQWETTMNAYEIALFQQATDPPHGNKIQTIYTVYDNGTGQQSYDWLVQIYNSNLTFSPVYFLWLRPGEMEGITSHYFNITNKAASSSASSSSTTFTSSTSSTTSITASSTSSAGPSKASDAAPAPSPSASTNADTIKVDLGVGLGIGIPLVLIAGMWIGIKTVKQRVSSHSTNSSVPLNPFPNIECPPDRYLPPISTNYYPDQVHEIPPIESPKLYEAPTDGTLIELGSRES